jgi:hypothetical protein
VVEGVTVCSEAVTPLFEKENTMKQHEKRYIIEVFMYGENKWVRSGNRGLTGFFATREGAAKALRDGDKSVNKEYHVRQK